MWVKDADGDLLNLRFARSIVIGSNWLIELLVTEWDADPEVGRKQALEFRDELLKRLNGEDDLEAAS